MDRKITALTVQKRNPNRVNVYLDGEFSFGLSRIVAAWLQLGQSLSPEKITSLQAQDENEVAYQKALRYLDYKPRTNKEIERKLRDKGFSDEVIRYVAQRLRSSGLVEDAVFARSWIESRTASRPRSRRSLALELRRKGVADEVIQDAMEVAEQDDLLAYQAAIRYAPRLSELEWCEFRNRLGNFLGRRGFSYGTIAQVVRKVWSESRSASVSTEYPNDEEVNDVWPGTQ